MKITLLLDETPYILVDGNQVLKEPVVFISYSEDFSDTLAPTYKSHETPDFTFIYDTMSLCVLVS